MSPEERVEALQKKIDNLVAELFDHAEHAEDGIAQRIAVILDVARVAAARGSIEDLTNRVGAWAEEQGLFDEDSDDDEEDWVDGIEEWLNDE